MQTQGKQLSQPEEHPKSKLVGTNEGTRITKSQAVSFFTAQKQN